MNKMKMDGLLLWYWHFRKLMYQNNGNINQILSISINKTYLIYTLKIIWCPKTGPLDKLNINIQMAIHKQWY